MARYAVTGAAGFIGSHLVARLKAQGHSVAAVDLREVPEREHLYGQADRVFTDWDLRERCELDDDIDRVYHLAADHGGAGYFHSDADQPAARNNMQIDLNVLRACEESGVERLFYASSFCAYPTAQQTRFVSYDMREDHLFEGTPEQCYGAEKRFMTQLCEAADFDARCGVFATIYGPGQEAEGIRAKFPTAITHRALAAAEAERTPPTASVKDNPIELWGDGSQVRTFLWIEDALDRIQAVMEADFYEGPVNIASDEAVTVQECAEWACENAGVEPNFDYRDDMPTGVDVRTPDNMKFLRLYTAAYSQTPAREGFSLLAESMR